METRRESTLKSMLSALWNLSAHSSRNKADICSTAGALEFLVKTLSYQSESKTLSIVESAGGILRNVSSHVATSEDYRAVLRHHNCLQMLLQQLRSPSLTVVSNACGTLWNLSARCKEDQKAMRDLGAVSMLRSLVHSRHKMIAMGSSAALKNLDASGLGSPMAVNSPTALQSSSTTLLARKQKALEQEIDSTLTEMCDNIDPISSFDSDSTRESSPFDRRMYRSLGGNNRAPYGRTATLPSSLLASRNGATPSRQLRSSSLERGSAGRASTTTVTVNVVSVDQSSAATTKPAKSTALGTTRTAWRSHENETSYTQLNYEEDDQPVDYSLKYAEDVGTLVAATHWNTAASGRQTDPAGQQLKSNAGKPAAVASRSVGKLDSTTTKKVMVYSAYRETDLDEPEQPTDFSLRYAEDEDYVPSGDTMKTYYMEGTPYETPFSCSSAASLTDLREAGFEG